MILLNSSQDRNWPIRRRKEVVTKTQTSSFGLLHLFLRFVETSETSALVSRLRAMPWMPWACTQYSLQGFIIYPSACDCDINHSDAWFWEAERYPSRRSETLLEIMTLRV